MRDYAKVLPKMWHGQTIKNIRKRGPEGVIVCMYLMTSPMSNMIGLFTQPLMYMAYETGLGIEGATKGLQDCIEEGFCKYDNDTETVWVVEMAGYQIASELKATDLRVKGIQKDFDALKGSPFADEFFDRYEKAFKLEKQASQEAPSKPLPSHEQEQEQEQESSVPKGTGGKPPADQSKSELWKAAVSLLSGQGMPEAQARSFVGKLTKDYPDGDIVLEAVRATVTEQPADARAYLKATCQRFSGERKRGGVEDWTRSAT